MLKNIITLGGNIVVEHQKLERKNLSIIGILLMGHFLGLLSETIMNVALPNIMNDFGVNTNIAQ